MSALPDKLGEDRRLTVEALLDLMASDGLIDAAEARLLANRLQSHAGDAPHPITAVGECRLEDPRREDATLTPEALTQWLAERTGMPYDRIDPLKIDVPSITSVLPYAYAARLNILPIRVTSKDVVIATAEPFVSDWEKELRPILKRDIQRVLCNPADVERYLVEFYALSKSVKASEAEDGEPRSRLYNLEQLTDLGKRGNLDANDQHIVNIVDWLLQYAFEQRASDIHLEPRREHGRVRFRIDGVLHEVYQIPESVMTAVTSRLKILGRMNVAEKRKPQDGRVKTRGPDGSEIEVRLSTMPTAFGEKLVMRIFDPTVLVRDFTALGFGYDAIDTWTSMIRAPHGIILVTGPTGSGKTTTLYSTLKQLARPEVNVCTIEDPIELIDADFNQMQVQSNIGLGFATGVRTLLRQDPDIIMVGEIRDLETAEVAVQAALTGHLVLSTLHTNDAPSAITRLLELGVPAYLIRATLLGVVAQRLVRTLCPHCKHPVALSQQRWESLVEPWKQPHPGDVNETVGCLECRKTGYLGRVGLFEMLPMTEEIKELVQPDVDVAELRKKAFKQGMEPLRLNGASKIAQGITTVEEVMRVAPPSAR